MMMVTQSIIAFLAAATILTMTPGLDTAMVLRTAVASGVRPAWSAAIGIGLGCLAWGALVALGLGAVLAASPTVFALLQWAGAGYLFWVGLQLIFKPRSTFDADTTARRAGKFEAFRRGFLTNVLNPKVGVFYVTFLPQFIPAGWNVMGFSMLLAGLHVLLGLVWCAGSIAATVPMSRMLRRAGVVKMLDRLTGGIFMAFGARLALAN